jgi:hypothetical protein
MLSGMGKKAHVDFHITEAAHVLLGNVFEHRNRKQNSTK